jgi:hypothetical protein
MLDVLRQDVRIGVRTWRRSPGLLCVAVLTLGLGVGAATALFGLVSHVLVKPLPYRDPGRLAVIKAERDYDGARQAVTASFPSPAVEIWPARLRTFERTAFYAKEVVALATDRGQELIDQAVVSASFFDTIGGEVVLGRGLSAADDTQPVAVISARLWERLHAGSADAVGRSITLNNTPLTIVGGRGPRVSAARPAHRRLDAGRAGARAQPSMLLVLRHRASRAGRVVRGGVERSVRGDPGNGEAGHGYRRHAGADRARA